MYVDPLDEETNNPQMSSLSDGTNTYDILDKNALHLSGGSMSGAIDMGSNAITGVADPTSDADVATKGYVDQAVSEAISGLLASEQLAQAIQTMSTGTAD